MDTKRMETMRAARLARDGGKPGCHCNGTCGYMASLCYECDKEETALMHAWAAEQPAPMAGEDASAYWHRIGGRFLDGWYTAAWSRINPRKPATS